MTVITRTARRYFATRAGTPSPRRVWLRANSSVWQHFDPSPRWATFCRFCGHVEDHGPTHHGVAPVVDVDKHNIGFVNIAGVRHQKFCDGTEEAT